MRGWRLKISSCEGIVTSRLYHEEQERSHYPIFRKHTLYSMVPLHGEHGLSRCGRSEPNTWNSSNSQVMIVLQISDCKGRLQKPTTDMTPAASRSAWISSPHLRPTNAMRETKFQNPHTQASQIGSVGFDRPSLFGFHVGKSVFFLAWVQRPLRKSKHGNPWFSTPIMSCFVEWIGECEKTVLTDYLQALLETQTLHPWKCIYPCSPSISYIKYVEFQIRNTGWHGSALAIACNQMSPAKDWGQVSKPQHLNCFVNVLDSKSLVKSGHRGHMYDAICTIWRGQAWNPTCTRRHARSASSKHTTRARSCSCRVICTCATWNMIWHWTYSSRSIHTKGVQVHLCF